MNNTNKRISIIVPIFNEELIIRDFYSEVIKNLKDIAYDYEIIFVNDGSKDSSLEILKELYDQDKKVKVVNFSRNFGHQIAISAGIRYAAGDAAIIMDADLQDPPAIVLDLLKKWEEGFDVVYAVRKKRRGESLFKLWTASLFYRIIKRLTKVDIPVDTGDFRLMDRKVYEELSRINERNPFVRGLVSWIGFKQTGIYYERQERFAGQTHYPLRKMIRFALDGITSFSFIPLQMATCLGFFVSFMSFIGIIVFLCLKIFTSVVVPGMAAIIISILFMGGVQLITLGIMGEYLGRIFDEVKQRPLYIVKKTWGIEEE